MRQLSRVALLVAATCLTAPCLAATPVAPAAKSVPVPTLVRQVSIPHTMFRLANGLTVIVHEDHKAPVVAVSTWYNVGSKDEPPGKTGFAHLFEHLMFNGTEDLPGDYFNYLQQIGATDYNGTTYYDRTNYFETVPAGALERTLFMESDRMGHLLGAVTQGVLDNQRSVVQNEKRQNDSRPGGLLQYAVQENLFPAGHPYHHTVIGSMDDLDAASLADVKQWFRDKYGPNNAVLVIAGDVTAAQAKPLVEKYFGSIPAGPVNHPAMAGVPTLAKAKSIAMKDHVATTIIQRYWAVPGLLDKQACRHRHRRLGARRARQLAARQDHGARREARGRGHRPATPLQRAGIFSVAAYVRPGVDPAAVAKRLDQVLADYVAKGPTADEVERAVMSEVSGRIRGLEQVGGFGGKAVSLAEGQTYAHDSDFYKKSLASYAAITPAAVRTAMQQWLRRPALKITLSPGERPAYAESKPVVKAPEVEDRRRGEGSAGDPAGRAAVRARLPDDRSYPAVERSGGRLRSADGCAGDPGRACVRRRIGIRPAADARPRLDDHGPARRGHVVQILAGNRRSGRAAGRRRQQQQCRRPFVRDAQCALAEPRAVARSHGGGDQGRGLPPRRRRAHPRAEADRDRAAAEGSDARGATPAADRDLRREPSLWRAFGRRSQGALRSSAARIFVGFERRWLRPDNVKIFIVSDRPLGEVQPLLEQRFGQWAAPAAPKGVKAFTAPPPRPASPKILLIDRPGAPQSSIVGAQLLPIDPRADIVPFDTANEVLGGTFLSRLNMDLRENKGWSYGVSGDELVLEHAVIYTVSAPVQADKTGGFAGRAQPADRGLPDDQGGYSGRAQADRRQ